MVNDVIWYKNQEYRVSALLPNKSLELMINKTGEVLTVQPSDGLYSSLKSAAEEQNQNMEIKQEENRSIKR